MAGGEHAIIQERITIRPMSHVPSKKNVYTVNGQTGQLPISETATKSAEAALRTSKK